MQFRFLRQLDRLAGRALLGLLAPAGRLFDRMRAAPRDLAVCRRFYFLKLHGGGSLLIALPSLLGLRSLYPDAEFVLISTGSTQAYAGLTGLFDRFVTIDPDGIFSLAVSGLGALKDAMRADVFVDLEPHSMLAAVFTLGSMAPRRLGFVKSNEYYRAAAYTSALYFNPHAPIHVFYDQIAGELGAGPAPLEACRLRLAAQLQRSVPAPLPPLPEGRHIVYLAPFCSDFAPERMMPHAEWPRLIAAHYGARPLTILLGGGRAEIRQGEFLQHVLEGALPQAHIVNLCGQRRLHETVGDIGAADAFWSIDSGLLHVARLLGKDCHSFWGPTLPRYRLRAMPGLTEATHWIGLACSPCIDSVEHSPCRGDNRCMRHFMDARDADNAGEGTIPTPVIHIDAGD